MTQAEYAVRNGCVGCVYLVEDINRPGVYKVGRTLHLRDRVVMFAKVGPVRLVWYILTNGPGALESHLHAEWQDCRVGGEWFRLTEKRVATFRSFRAVNWKGYDPVCPSWWESMLGRETRGGAPPLVPVEIGRPLYHPRPKPAAETLEKLAAAMGGEFVLKVKGKK
jgi:hypothetical protein